MYYSSPFKHQERGREDKGKHGKLTKEEFVFCWNEWIKKARIRMNNLQLKFPLL